MPLDLKYQKFFHGCLQSPRIMEKFLAYFKSRCISNTLTVYTHNLVYNLINEMIYEEDNT